MHKAHVIAWLLPVLALSYAGGDAHARQAPATQPQVYSVGNGVSAPTLIKEVKPRYTAEAETKRIEGTVVMTCVVKPDGTVSEIKITRSIDPILGLDHEAVDALRQWRFEPGRKDGVPVPVLIDIEMSFTLRDRNWPQTSWPEAFTREGTSTDGWEEALTDAGGLHVKVAYPQTWRLRRNPAPARLLEVHGDADRTWYLVLAAPLSASSDLSAPMLPAKVTRTAESLRQKRADTRALKILHSGQARAQNQYWIWFETGGPATDASDTPPDLVANDTFATFRRWDFITTVGRQQIAVSCILLERSDASRAEKTRRALQAGSEFASMLARIEIHQ